MNYLTSMLIVDDFYLQKSFSWMISLIEKVVVDDFYYGKKMLMTFLIERFTVKRSLLTFLKESPFLICLFG